MLILRWLRPYCLFEYFVDTKEEKYYFYTSNKRGNRDIYWVNATIIEKLKPGNLK